MPHLRSKRTADGCDSHKALAEANKHVREVKARAPEVREVASSLRDFREKNHFAEQLIQIMSPHAGRTTR